MQFNFVTSNQNKVREVEAILGVNINRVDIDLPEIQSLDHKEVAHDKVLRAYEHTKKPVMVEDTGLFIQAFDGFPGALSKWLLITVGPKKLCDIMKPYEKKAIFRTCIAFYNGKDVHVFDGKTHGRISDSPRGTVGFGWDPIFIPDGHDKTFAEMTFEQKNAISHRGKALKKFKEYLNSL